MTDKKRLRALIRESDVYLYPPMDFRDSGVRDDVLGVMSDMVNAGATKVRPLYRRAVERHVVGKRLLEKAVKLSEEKLKKVT
jgi:hypothetical protein